MKRVGITGLIGAGKSFVGSHLRSRNYQVLDADKMVHELYRDNFNLREELLKTYGKECLTKEGVNRCFFSELIFTNTIEKEKLESIVYPYLTEAVFAFLKDSSFENKSSCDFKFVEAALLSHTQEIVNCLDEIWIVKVPEEIRLERLIARGLEYNEALKRIKSQNGVCEKECFSNKKVYFLENSEGKPCIEQQIEMLLKK